MPLWLSDSNREVWHGMGPHVPARQHWSTEMDLDDLEQEIATLKSRLKESRTHHAEANRELEQLAAEHDELKLYVATILRVLGSKGLVSKDELRQLIQSIDAEDGRSDNAFRNDIVP